MISVSKYPFVRCLYPQSIVNRYTNEPLVVPCGRCEACLLQKSAMETLKCRLESKCAEYIYFVTLTYDAYNVPLCEFIPSDEILFEENKWKFIVVDSSNNNSPFVGQILGEVVSKDLDLFALKRKSNHDGKIAYLRQYDVQCFLKRLRKHISKQFKDEKIRYYCVGEYGPKHYRPHWHFLLYFNREELAQVIRQIISTCWTLGFVDVGKASGKGISYVTSYVNSRSCVPSLLEIPATKSKATHSIHLGEEFLKNGIEEVHRQKAADFVRRSVCLNDRNAEFSLWRSLQNYYYPKCVGYHEFSDDELYNSYTIISKVRDITGFRRPFQIAKVLTQAIRVRYRNSVDEYHSEAYRSLLNWFEDQCGHISLNLYHTYNDHRPALYNPDWWPKLQSRIYRILFISAHFVDNICQGDPNLYRTKIDRIVKFWSDVELLYLGEQIQKEDMMIRCDREEDTVYLYTNMLSQSEIDDMMNTPVGRAFHEATNRNFENSMKHKCMNDVYDIFNPETLSYNDIYNDY